MIRKLKGKYVVLSETAKRRMGTYRTLAEAKKRLRQIEYFKHLAGKRAKIMKWKKKKYAPKTS